MAHDPSDCMQCPMRLDCVTARMAPRELADLQPAIRRRRMGRGDELATEGEVATTVRVIRIGTAFNYRRGVDGRTRPIGIAVRGSALGLFGVFGQPTQVSAMAAADSRICEIPVRTLGELAARDEGLSRYLASTAVEACGKIAAWSEAMRVRGVTNQLAYTLLLLADAQHNSVIDLPTHSALAELLGSTRETMARSLATLEQEGAIARRPLKQCEVLREQLLARLDRNAP